MRPFLIVLLTFPAACRTSANYAEIEGVTGPQLVNRQTAEETVPSQTEETVPPKTEAINPVPAPTEPAGYIDPAATSEAADEFALEKPAPAHGEVSLSDPEMMGTMTADEEEATRNVRREKILAQLGDKEIPLGKLLTPDEYDGPILSGRSIEAYAEGQNMKAILLAQAALGADPGNSTRRRLLTLLEKKTGLESDPNGIVPLRALIHLEMKKAEKAFFEEDFGNAIQYCRRAIYLDAANGEAWVRLGSAHFATGNREQARSAYAKALALDPDDKSLRDFLSKNGWAQK